MPTEADFEAAAKIVEDESNELFNTLTPLKNLKNGIAITGGSLETTVDDSLDAIHDGLNSTWRQAVDIAATLRERAELCAEYTVACNDYRRAHGLWVSKHAHLDPDSRPPEPTEPVKEFDWIEEG